MNRKGGKNILAVATDKIRIKTFNPAELQSHKNDIDTPPSAFCAQTNAEVLKTG